MPWLVGIDEAGYGPNLGPFVMSSVCCRVPDPEVDLWECLSSVLRKGGKAEKTDTRIIVDDSKVVYTSGKGLSGLERGLFSIFGLSSATLNELAQSLCGELGELQAESWYVGDSPLPTDAEREELDALRPQFASACSAMNISQWRARGLVVCPTRFNTLAEKAKSKSAVLADGFVRLLTDIVTSLPDDDIHVHIDKQGGRNTYASQIQEALPVGMVFAIEERAERSRYRVVGLGRELRLTFEPRADGKRLCVAVASMVSKYLRELFMGEFNRFWQQHVPGLKPTAGYPGDAPRFLEAIRPAATALQIPETAIWRQR